jgi:hypothetical protein
VISPRELETILGETVAIPDVQTVIHLQFRRYAGCPVCNVHLRSIAVRHGELLAAGVREVVVFHSKRETMLEHQALLPFAAIADPEKHIYAEFGVEKMAVRMALHPRSWRAAFFALTHSPNLRGATGKGEEHLGLPAEFLIRPDGSVMAAKYGRVADDHWSVDDILSLSRTRTQPAGGAGTTGCSPR